jgi:predicted GNAT family acetyltransferase
MTDVTAKLDIRHNTAAQRFEVVVEGQLARADYRIDDGVMRMFHTEVPVAFEGRGIAATLVRAAIEYARENGLKILPACSYVRVYMRRHPEAQSMLATTAR